MTNPYGPEFEEYAKHVREKLVPMIESSATFISITPSSPDKVDVKFAIELGIAVMLNKPIIAVVQPGTKIPDKFRKVVDKFVELDINDLNSHDKLVTVIKEFHEKTFNENNNS